MHLTGTNGVYDCGRCFTVVDRVVDGDLQRCAMAEEHAHHLCFSSGEQINNSGTPSWGQTSHDPLCG
jgi:hypothetical protein